jgi:hypothetical protein
MLVMHVSVMWPNHMSIKEIGSKGKTAKLKDSRKSLN